MLLEEVMVAGEAEQIFKMDILVEEQAGELMELEEQEMMDNVAAIILAAGKGTRMKSGLVKVLHPIVGQPMIAWSVDAARNAGAAPLVLVVGYQANALLRHFRDASDIR